LRLSNRQASRNHLGQWGSARCLGRAIGTTDLCAVHSHAARILGSYRGGTGDAYWPWHGRL